MKIQVTQDDIDKGVRGNCWFCPVATAVMRAAGAQEASVGSRISVDGEDCGVTPRHVRDFTRYFDSGFAVAPFEFDLELPPTDH